MSVERAKVIPSADWPRCATCRYWGDTPYRYDDDETMLGMRICGRMVELWEASEWSDNGSGIERSLKEEFADHLAFTQDGSSYHAELRTKAEFGCVMHERKD